MATKLTPAPSMSKYPMGRAYPRLHAAPSHHMEVPGVGGRAENVPSAAPCRTSPLPAYAKHKRREEPIHREVEAPGRHSEDIGQLRADNERRQPSEHDQQDPGNH